MAQPLLTRWQISLGGRTCLFTKAGRLFISRLSLSAGWGCTFGQVLGKDSSPRPQRSVLPLASHLLLLLSACVPIRHFPPLHGSAPMWRSSSFRLALRMTYWSTERIACAGSGQRGQFTPYRAVTQSKVWRLYSVRLPVLYRWFCRGGAHLSESRNSQHRSNPPSNLALYATPDASLGIR